MAMGDTSITLVGNLVEDPELRFTQSGAPVANFRVASTPRQFNRQTNQWEDQESLFLSCTAWRNMAENAAESLSKGMRVIVQGNLKQRSYETREGEKRTVFEVDVQEVGPSLRNATAQVAKQGPRDQQGGFGGQQSQGDPWQGASSSGGFSGQAPQGGNQGGFSGQQGDHDSPPF